MFIACHFNYRGSWWFIIIEKIMPKQNEISSWFQSIRRQYKFIQLRLYFARKFHWSNSREQAFSLSNYYFVHQFQLEKVTGKLKLQNIFDFKYKRHYCSWIQTRQNEKNKIKHLANRSWQWQFKNNKYSKELRKSLVRILLKSIVNIWLLSAQ